MRQKNKSKRHYKSCYEHQRGVDVLYHGCAMVDHFSKSRFADLLKREQFEPGDKYLIDGTWLEVAS